MRSTPKPPSISKPPPVGKHREQAGTVSAEYKDDKIKWILAAAISAGILISLFLIPLMLLSSNGGGSAGGKDEGARVKGAAALSNDNGTSKGTDEPQSLPAPEGPATTDSMVESPNESIENTSAEDESIEQQSVPMLLTYKPKPRSTSKSSVGGSGTKSGSEIVASGGRNPFIGDGPPAKSTVFVVDVSGSMQNPDRLPRVLASMTRAIELLKSNQKFAIVLFDDQAYAFPKQPAWLDASDKNKQNAFDWLNVTKGGGGTNPIPGMAIAIGLAPEKIVLLSDGEFDPHCIDLVRNANRRNRQPARIDCVGLAEDIETLKEIAKQNKGIYYQAF
jgi:Mg-chelatase subunit ChlD